MIRLLGALLVAGGAAAIGFGAANRLNQRTNALRAMCGALSMMERELSFRLTPMPELLLCVASSASEPASAFFQSCADSMSQSEQGSMTELWSRTLEQELPDLYQEDVGLLAPLGGILGRFDADDQRQALCSVTRELERAVCQAEDIHARQGKVYSILGLVAGAFFVILLL